MYYFVPVILIVVLNTLYHIAAKGMPQQNNAFSSLVLVYATAMILSLMFFFATGRGESLAAEFKRANWAPFLLGASVVGLEFGYILLYKVGWNIGTGSTVCNILLALAMLAVGALFYKDHITFAKAAGVFFCAVGLFFLNR